MIILYQAPPELLFKQHYLPQYVGQTGNTLQSNIKTNQNILVARHFSGRGRALADLRYTAKDQVRSLAPCRVQETQTEVLGTRT